MAVATLTASEDAQAQIDGTLVAPSNGTATTITLTYSSKIGATLMGLLFKWVFSSIPAGATISAVTFKLYQTAVSGMSGAEGSWAIARCTESWSEDGADQYDSDSKTDVSDISTAIEGYAAGYHSISHANLLAWVQGWYAGSITNYGLLFYCSAQDALDADDNVTYGMSEHGTAGFRPVLEVTYNNPPTTPGVFTVPAAGSDHNASISADWGDSTDVNGDSITYDLEYAIAPYSSWTDIGGLTAGSSRVVDTSGWPAGSYKMRVRAYDGTTYSAYRESDIFTITHNVAPGVPTSVGRDPSNDSTDTTPLLTATITDANAGQQIKARFQIYQNDGTTLVGTVDSAFRTGNGVVTAEYSSALPVGQYKVQAKTIDDTALESAYSAQASFQVTTLVTKDLSISWHTKILVNDDLTIYWNVARNGEKDLTLLWNTLVGVNKDLEILWNTYPHWENVPYEAGAPTWDEVAP